MFDGKHIILFALILIPTNGMEQDMCGGVTNIENCTCADGIKIVKPPHIWNKCGRHNRPAIHCDCKTGGRWVLPPALCDDGSIDIVSCLCNNGKVVNGDEVCGQDNKPKTCECRDGSIINMLQNHGVLEVNLDEEL